MKRPPTPVIALLVLLLIGGGVSWWWQSRDTGTTDGVVSGSVEATRYQVYTTVGGRVTEVSAAEGQQVEADDELLTIDDAALQIQLRQAGEGVNAAQAALDEADGESDAVVAEARARLNQARAGVELAQLQVDRATVTAPHAGTVVSVLTAVGQNASPGVALATIQDDTDLTARVYVPQNRIGDVKVGDTVTVGADGAPDGKGTVILVSDTAEFTPNTVQTQDERTKLVYAVQVKIADTSGRYKAGMPVDVTL